MDVPATPPCVLPVLPSRRRALRLLGGLGALSVLVLLMSVSVGSVSLSWTALLGALTHTAGDDPAAQVLALRLPRVLAAYATGGLLSLSGALMQVLLANPLADPYVLGVSGGAAVGALALMWLGFEGLPVDVAAFAGALFSLLLVLAPLRRMLRARATPVAGVHLLLSGVVLAAGWSALITLLLTLAPDAQLRGMLFWLMGDLAGVTRWQVPALGLLAVLLAVRPLARDLNALLRGEAQAFALGVPVARRRLQLYLLASFAAALAVTTAGAVGFVGLLVPHAVRLLIGNDQRVLLPASALSGGALLALADTCARSAFAPVQLPVGVLTALLGVPVLLVLLARRVRT